jgi:hypothetical protein
MENAPAPAAGRMAAKALGGGKSGRRGDRGVDEKDEESESARGDKTEGREVRFHRWHRLSVEDGIRPGRPLKNPPGSGANPTPAVNCFQIGTINRSVV